MQAKQNSSKTPSAMRLTSKAKPRSPGTQFPRYLMGRGWREGTHTARRYQLLHLTEKHLIKCTKKWLEVLYSSHVFLFWLLWSKFYFSTVKQQAVLSQYHTETLEPSHGMLQIDFSQSLPTQPMHPAFSTENQMSLFSGFSRVSASWHKIPSGKEFQASKKTTQFIWKKY